MNAQKYAKNGGKLYKNGGELIPNKQAKTKLSSGQQIAYEKWKSENKYNESDDYDLAGYWKEEGFKGLQHPNLSPSEKIKEVDSSVYPTLDKFYKENTDVAGMNHAPGEVSKNPYSKIPDKNLKYVIGLEKMRDIMSNDKNAPKPNYRITGEQKDYFKTIKDNNPNTIDYIDTPKQIQRETIASRLYTGDNMGNSKYTKKQNKFVDELDKYANTKPNHLPDKFKRLAPFGNGDGYQQLSDESNVASQFDKRGQGFWNGDKFIAYKNGGNVQQLSKTNVQFNGNSHENGGIKEPLVNGVRLNGTEVEGNESMSTSNGQKFVFSENLGFAQQHKPLAKAMGKIEKYLKSNPNDPIRKRTLNTLKEREEQLKVKQEETKEALGLENNLGEMRLGGAIKRKDGVYIDREGVMKYPLKNGGLTKYPNGGIPDYSVNGATNNFLQNYSDQQYMNSHGAGLNVDGRSGRMTGIAKATGYMEPLTYSKTSTEQSMSPYNLPNAHFLGGSNVGTTTVGNNPSSTAGVPGNVSGNNSGSKMNWGNLASKIIPYAGVASNYMLNEKARNMTTPKEDLPDYVKYKPVDYSASKIEADQQRRQLNKSLTQNVTNSAVAAALKAKNLGTTIGAKNLINQEETNVNTEGINRINLVNNQIQQRRNQIDVENRDRDYNKEQRYLTQKGQIVNNFSDIYQQQSRDRRLYDLEDRKIDVLRDVDTGRGVYKRNLEDDTKKQKESYKKGGIVKKTNKLYNKSKK